MVFIFLSYNFNFLLEVFYICEVVDDFVDLIIVIGGVKGWERG